MKYTAALSVVVQLLIVQGVFCAPPSISIPAEIKATSDYVTVTPTTNAKSVVYVGLSGVDPFPGVFKDPTMFVLPVRGLKEGKYRFAAVAALADEQTRVDFTVVVGNSPTPPGPDPNPPVPEPNALAKAVQAAYDKETDADKSTLRKKFIGVFNAVGAIAQDQKYKTWGDIYLAIGEAHKAVGSSGKLLLVQDAIKNYLKDRVPSDPKKVLTTDDRVLIADCFKAITSALEQVK